MMRSLFKAGPWLFVLAIGWYLGGNYLIHHLRAKNLALAQTRHNNRQQFEIDKVLMLHVTKDQAIATRLVLVFDQSVNQAVVENNNLELTAQGQLVNGVLTLSLLRQVRQQNPERHESYAEIIVRLPPSVQTVMTDSPDSMTVGGDAPLDVLELVLLNCGNGMKLGPLEVKQLKLTSRCRQPPDTRYSHGGFELDSTLTSQSLDVSMQWGSLTVAMAKLPQQIRLDLGDAVAIRANSEFVRKAQLNKLP